MFYTLDLPEYLPVLLTLDLFEPLDSSDIEDLHNLKVNFDNLDKFEQLKYIYPDLSLGFDREY